jgi:hypothetical protein
MQVITIQTDGTMSGLQVKPGKGLDLTKMGKAKVERVSEILWHEDTQKWFVQILAGPMAGEKVTLGLTDKHSFDYLGSEMTASSFVDSDNGSLIMCDDYDTGVKLEVAFLDHCRLRGVF